MYLTFIMLLNLFSTPKPLVGTYDIMHLQHRKKYAWFDTGFAAYQPKADAVKTLKTHNYSHTRIIVFGGTWCSDTQFLLPKFCKTLESAGINPEICTLYLLDKEKHSPLGNEQNYHITNVPTVIVLESNSEVGRITETATKTVEEDLADILSKK